ncbi:uncharacterized protein [Triticum aestivum]|uniref:uncharacterized protein n=1 Tax=Triticum aestivum TaxID=4565 RepID=UPI001D0034E3|nr:uncharacterized protein LOC123072569 [Triticum aestivum]
MRGGRRAGAGEQQRRAGEQDSYATELNGTTDGTACLCRERGQTTGDDEEGFYGVLQLRRGSGKSLHSSTSHPLFLTPSYLPPRSTTQLCSSLSRPDANAMEDATPPLLRSMPPTPWRTPLHPCSSLKHYSVPYTKKFEVCWLPLALLLCLEASSSTGGAPNRCPRVRALQEEDGSR